MRNKNDMFYNEYTLSNNLRVIHVPSFSKVAYCGVVVDVGTRDELTCQYGMAHFVEHVIFKGTQKRKAWHILNRMENVGGDLNAFTNKEETVVYTAFLAQHIDRALELLADILFSSTFPQKELNKEIEVVLDEIQSYQDSPSELIFDDFEDLVFSNHGLGHNILGDADLLRTFTTENLLQFTSKFYQPENMVLFVSGNIPFKKIVRLASRYFEAIPMGNIKREKRVTPSLYLPEKIVLNKDTHQAHVMIGAKAYDAYDKRRTALYLLNNILGGPGMNSRLNVSLREKRGLVYNIESNLTSYTDTGLFSIYFGTNPSDLNRCLSLVYNELKKIRTEKLSTLKLSMAKKQLIGQIAVGSDNNENNILNLSKTYLHYGKCESYDVLFQRIEALTAEELLSVANELLSEDYLSTLIYK